MKKYFNVTGVCKPDIHYMVDLQERLKQMKEYVDAGEYFVINRARQYGKTTFLRALNQYLREEFIVVSLSFQRMSSDSFSSENIFSCAFASIFLREVYNKKKEITGFQKQELDELGRIADGKEEVRLTRLFEVLSDLCQTADRPVVLMIDEIDNASNNQVFLDFLALLRDYFLDRDETDTFQSVILAGVYDIKNLKQRIRPKEEHRYNSPWNIAADFDIRMSFSKSDIAGMLSDYEDYHRTGMDIELLSNLIYEYTSGYPYLVSKICKVIDEQKKEWSREGVSEAVRMILKEPNTLFDDMAKKLEDEQDLRKMLRDILFQGKNYPFHPYNHVMNIGKMFGFIAEKDGEAVVSNRIFEMQLYNLFLSEEITEGLGYQLSVLDRNQFITDGMLDMDLVLTKFMVHFTDIYADSTAHFVEENGRRLFLLYLKPIINGTGNYYIEAQTRNQTRTDVVIDYKGKQFIVELKIWHGEEYNRKGEKQLADYLEEYHLEKGYLLTFNFNKHKKVGTKEIRCGNKRIFEVVV